MKKAVFLVSALLGALVLAPNAHANPCGGEVSQPFADYGDFREYTLAPGGDFESGAPGWSLSWGAWLTESEGDDALFLAPGASALSPPICVTPQHPHVRMFAAAQLWRSAMKVKIYYGSESASAGRVYADRGWDPTRDISLEPGRFELDPGSGSGTVRLRFIAVDDEGILLDDLWVDPRRRS